MGNSIRKDLEELKDKVLDAMPRIVASTAVDYFQDTFGEKAFDGKKWPGFSSGYKHRTNGSLMIDSAELMNSIRPTRMERNVVEVSAGNDKVNYAQPHNEGFSGSVVVPAHKRTGKKGKEFIVKSHTRKMFLPKRQFMGDSEELGKLIEKRAKGFINSIINK